MSSEITKTAELQRAFDIVVNQIIDEEECSREYAIENAKAVGNWPE